MKNTRYIDSITDMPDSGRYLIRQYADEVILEEYNSSGCNTTLKVYPQSALDKDPFNGDQYPETIKDARKLINSEMRIYVLKPTSWDLLESSKSLDEMICEMTGDWSCYDEPEYH